MKTYGTFLAVAAGLFHKLFLVAAVSQQANSQTGKFLKTNIDAANLNLSTLQKRHLKTSLISLRQNVYNVCQIRTQAADSYPI